MSDSREMSPHCIRVAKDGDEHLFYCTVPSTLTPLLGHFPGTPIVPGVCQLRWVVDFWRSVSKEPLSISRLVQVKFQRLLRPDDTFCIGLALRNAAIHYRIFNDSGSFASGKMEIRT